MSEFDIKAREWDQNQTHVQRSEAIAKEILKAIPINKKMTAMEFGAGTGLLSFMLKDRFANITLIDTSQEMVRVAQEKIEEKKVKNMRALFIDLENEELDDSFNCIFSQMALHHVSNVGYIFEKFFALLSPGGYLAIVDLYPEDGSFHGQGFTGHKGFSVLALCETLIKLGYVDAQGKQCYTLRKPIESGEEKDFPLFLLTAKKPIN